MPGISGNAAASDGVGCVASLAGGCEADAAGVGAAGVHRDWIHAKGAPAASRGAAGGLAFPTCTLPLCLYTSSRFDMHSTRLVDVRTQASCTLMLVVLVC